MTDSSASVSSHEAGESHFPLGFDADLLLSVRREVFRAPQGFSALDCCNRIRELIQSELHSPFSLRTTDLLILGNAVVSDHPEFANIGVPKTDVVSLVNNHVYKRHRLQNALCVIQFAKFRNLTNSWNRRQDCELLCYSIDRLHEPRSFDMIELLRILIAQDTFVPTGSLFSSIEHALTRSVDAPSPRTNSLALKIVENIYTRNLGHCDGELISLSIEVMNGRHCGSPTVLLKMIDLAETLTEDLPLVKRIVEGIRLHQLSRWKSVKGIFLNNPSIKVRLDKLLHGSPAAVRYSKEHVQENEDPPISESVYEPVIDPPRNPLSDWVIEDSIVDSSVENLSRRLAELETRIAQYEERIDRPQPTTITNLHKFSNEPNNGFGLKVRRIIGDMFTPVVVPVRPLSEVSFDEFREHVIRRKRTKLAQTLVSRKLGGHTKLD